MGATFKVYLERRCRWLAMTTVGRAERTIVEGLDQKLMLLQRNPAMSTFVEIITIM